MADTSTIIGIDLGTTNSCVAVTSGEEVTVIPNAEGNRTTPSVVAFAEGERLVGQLAKRQAVANPTQTVYAAKRLIGRKFDEPQVQDLREFLPYSIVAADNGDAWVDVGERNCSPSEIGAHVLTKMKQAAEDYLGQTVHRAIVTVPAYFDDAQRQATKDAGRIAGLEVERIINEPTAATLAYGISNAMEGEETSTVAVYDLGGGTFDVSILELREGAFEVLATAGDTFLGGEDFDNVIVERVAAEFQSDQEIDLRGDKLANQRLKEAAEKAKHELSYSDETEVNLPFIASRDGQPIHLQTTLTRTQLEEMTSELVQRTLIPCRQALEDAELELSDIDELLLVGGQTRMPLVQRTVAEFFGREPRAGVNPDEVVASGAAIQGAILAGEVKNMVLLDVVPLNIGVETAGGVFTPLIPKGTTIPTRKSEIFSTSVDNQPVVPVHVMQGLREMADDCRSLAQLQLTDIPPAPRGVPQIRVTFDINADGILSVSARDMGTGRSCEMTVQATSGLDEAQLERLTAEAEANQVNDSIRRELAELHNRAETLMYTCERSLETFGENLGEVDRADIERHMSELRAALQRGDDPSAIRESLQTLETSSHQIYEAMLATAESSAPDDEDPEVAVGED